MWAHNRSCGEFINELEQNGTIKPEQAAKLRADPAFQKMYDEFIAVKGVEAAVDIARHPYLAGEGGRPALDNRPGFREIDPRFKTDTLRDSPGVAHGGEDLAGIPPGYWLEKSTGGVGRIPQEVATMLRGQHFTDMRNFRQDFWKAVASIPTLLAQFKPQSQGKILRGFAPLAPKQGHSGQRITFELDHIVPLELSGAAGVYDLGNIMVAPAKVNLSFEKFG